MRIGILGRTEMLFNTINMLLKKGYEIVFIGTCKASAEYRIKEKDFESVAKENNIPFFCDQKLKDHIGIMRDKADVVLSMNWISIIEKDIISLFPHGILNCHPGKLPKYRGNACPNWAIINGEKTYSITIHRMKAGELDSGEIICQKDYFLDDDTTITDVYNNMYEEVPILFMHTITLIEQNNYKIYAQDEDKASRCYPRIPSDSFIDWNLSSVQICRNIRASAPPFKGAYTYFKEVKCHIFSCDVEYCSMQRYVYPGQVVYRNKDEGVVKIATTDGNICIKDVYVNGIKYSAPEVFTSTRIRLNYGVQDEIFELKNRVKELERLLKNEAGNMAGY